MSYEGNRVSMHSRRDPDTQLRHSDAYHSPHTQRRYYLPIFDVSLVRGVRRRRATKASSQSVEFIDEVDSGRVNASPKRRASVVTMYALLGRLSPAGG